MILILAAIACFCLVVLGAGGYLYYRKTKEGEEAYPMYPPNWDPPRPPGLWGPDHDLGPSPPISTPDIGIPPLPDTLPAPSNPPPDTYIGKNVVQVKKMLAASHPNFTVRLIKRGQPVTLDFSSHRIDVLYKQLPIPPNVRAVPGTFTRVVNVYFPVKRNPIRPPPIRPPIIKKSIPHELIGRPFTKGARARIQSHYGPGVTNIQKIPHGALVTADQRPNRVRVYVDSADTIVRISRG